MYFLIVVYVYLVACLDLFKVGTLVSWYCVLSTHELLNTSALVPAVYSKNLPRL